MMGEGLKGTGQERTVAQGGTRKQAEESPS